MEINNLSKIPKVTVLTTVYNCEKYVKESVRSILDQTYKDFEYVIINDGSTDKTSEIVKELAEQDPRILFIENEKNLGRVNSLNKALELCRGLYIAIQDADDISLPERLELQIPFLEKNSDYVIVGSNILIMDENENFISQPVRPVNDFDAKFNLLFRCTFANPSVVFRKKIIDENHLRYEKEFDHSEDFRFISRLSMFGKVYNFEESLVKYRKHFFNNSMIYYDILDAQSAVIAKDNLKTIGIDVTKEQSRRARNLLASRGIDKKFLYDDVTLILNSIKTFQEKNKQFHSVELANILKRMAHWLGRKNILFKPKYTLLYLKIKFLRFKIMQSAKDK